MFGTSEYLNKIEDIPLKGPNGEALYLGYKHSIHSFIAPYRVTDDGYILGIVGQQRYYGLNPDMVAKLQAQNHLPNPLPTYSLSLFDYAVGNMTWIILAGFGVSGIAGLLRRRKRKTAVPFAEAGLEAHRAGNLDAAISEYGEALARFPKFTNVLALRGDAYRARGEFDLAIADYSKVIRSESKNAEVLLARGATFEAKNLLPSAISDYTRAIKISKAPFAYFARANAHMSSGDPAAAVKDYTSAIGKGTMFAPVYQNRGAAHEKLGRIDLAQADYLKARQLAAANQSQHPA